MLTLAAAKKAESGDRDYKLFDERGLFLLVHKAGGKYWRFKYRYRGKEKLLSFGVFPEVTLTEARIKRDDARKQLRDDIDPGAKRVKARLAAGESFEAIYRDWLAVRGPKSTTGDERLKRIFEGDLLPILGGRPARDITPPDLLDVIRRIEARGAIETGRRANQFAGQVFRFGIATSRCDRDPSQDIRDALATPTKNHFSAITEPKAFGRLLCAIDDYQGTPVVSAALKLSALLFCRPGELRHMTWSEVVFDAGRIEIAGERMKMGEPHIIPLSEQALAIFQNLHELHRRGDFVFHSAKTIKRPISENAVRAALRTMGFDNDTHTGHGFRASARTMLDEVLEFPVDWIEHQLAHSVRDANGRAYNRTKHLKQRAGMMQAWADYLDSLRAQSASL